MRQGGGRRRAFTLLELLAVLTLVSLVVVLSAGSMAGRRDAVTLRKSCGLMAAAARQGRLMAMEGRQACRLILDIDNQTVQLEVLSSSEEKGEISSSAGVSGYKESVSAGTSAG